MAFGRVWLCEGLSAVPFKEGYLRVTCIRLCQLGARGLRVRLKLANKLSEINLVSLETASQDEDCATGSIAAGTGPLYRR